MENKDSILIRKYINLVESIKTKTEEPLNEQIRMFQDLVKTLARTVEVEKALWQTLKTEIPAIGNKFKSAAEFKAAAEAGKITAVESAEIVKYAIKNVPEVAMKMKGLLRGQPEFQEIAKQVFPKGTQMAADASKLKLAQETMAKFGIEAKEAENMLRKASQEAGGAAGVTTRSINKAVEKRGAQAAKTGTGVAKDAAKTAEQTKKITDGVKQIKTGGDKFTWFINIWNKYGKNSKTVVQDGVKTVSVTKKLIQWALLAGGGYLLYSLLTSSDGSDVVVVDEEGKKVDPNLTSGLAECLRRLIENKTGEINETSDGNPFVVVKKTGNSEFDSAGGLKFFMTGRVFTYDNSKRGNWKCKDGKIQTIPEISMINEQSETEMANDVETMIDLLDFPVSGSDLSQARTLLSKYANSSKGKEFLQLYKNSGLGSGSLQKSLDYIATFQAGSVLSKNKMYELIKQIESGKTGGEEQQGGGTADLSGIEITWDGENKEEEKPKPQDDDLPRIQTFFDCKDFPFRFGCRNPKIKEIQRCLGMDAKYQTGNFGPLTLAKLRNQYGTAQISDVSSSGKIDETLYQTIMRNCGSTPPPQPNTGTTTTATGTTTTTTTGATTTTPPKPAEPAGTKEAPKTTQLNREGCKSLFKTIDERDQAQGKTTATSTEKEQLKFCMQQYNFGVGTGVNKMKRRYGLTASGGDRGIR